eukprot:3370319-Prymnesium_polylepis.1
MLMRSAEGWREWAIVTAGGFNRWQLNQLEHGGEPGAAKRRRLRERLGVLACAREREPQATHSLRDSACVCVCVCATGHAQSAR